MPRFVAHLDADAFYASAEQRRLPWLKGRQVGILGNQGVAVIAKSREMKKCGVTTGEPIWEARRKCPNGLFLKRDFRWYEVLSKAMLAVVRKFSSETEYYSIDEFFFTGDEPDPTAFGKRVQAEILQVVGLPVTIGIARSRTQAKLVSDLAKPFGVRAILEKPEMRDYLAKLPAKEISGIGKQRAYTLSSFGIYTCLDFVNADRKLILRILTKTGEGLWYEMRGERINAIDIERPLHKMISRGGSMAGRVMLTTHTTK